MKKFIFSLSLILLFSTLLLNSVIVSATPMPSLPSVENTEECNHDVEKTNSSVKPPVKLDDEYHTVIETYDEVCSKCKEVINSGKTKETKEKHVFNGDVCTKCNYTKSCKHENVKTVTDNKKNYRAIENDAVYHTVITYTQKQCSCGEFIGEKVASETKETHNFVNDICENCSFKKAKTECAHSDKTKIITEESVKHNSAQNDAENHITITETWQKCTVCNSIIGDKSGKEETEPHQFEGNICTLCKYQKPDTECAHEDKSKLVDEESQKYSIIENDDESHKVIKVKQQKCIDCNSLIGEKDISELKEVHAFNEDAVCTICGYSKIVEESELAKAIDFLKENNIMVGDENGDFRPNSYMTRAEYAKIIFDFVGDGISLGTETDYFTDVPVEHWAFEYIGKVNQAGLMVGYGNGIFGIDDTLTEEQAVTVLCRMLGDTYDDVSYIETSVDEKGGYSDGYISIAGERGINIVGLQKTVPATRARVAKWLYQLYNIKNNL